MDTWERSSFWASFGWYYYYLNEAFHIATEGIFWSLLIELDGKPKEVEGFIDNLISPVLELSEKELKINKLSNLLDVIISVNEKEMSDLLSDIHLLYKKVDNSSKVLLRSLELMMLIYKKITDVQGQVLEVAQPLVV